MNNPTSSNQHPKSSISNFLNRRSEQYLKNIASLLTIDSLIKTSKPLDEKDKDDKEMLEHGYKSKATIYFCGLAGLTLFSIQNNPNRDEYAAIAFKDLLKDGVKKLDEQGVALQIKFLFAYPYSNFMYDLLYLEVNEQRYLSAEDMKGLDKYEYTFKLDEKLTIETIGNSTTFHRLIHSLGRIQTFVDVNAGLWNVQKWKKENKYSPHNIIVKFCPINILCCMLRINNVIVSDVYTYCKREKNAQELALLTPITYLEIPLPNDETKHEEENEHIDAFCGFLSHFKYLWDHPLTLYSMDATKYDRNYNHLHEIRKPLEISYDKKAKRMLRKMNKSNASNAASQAQADNWKQFVRNELLNNCSKVLAINNTAIVQQEIQPLKIFIIGAWDGDKPNEFMSDIHTWIMQNLSQKNNSGLQLEPDILRIENGEDFNRKLYNSLDSSHLGIVIQTLSVQKNGKKYSKPNVYLEKGYLMGKLRTLKTKSKRERQPVFVFTEESTLIETDNIGFGFTKFNKDDFSSKMYKFVYWLWDITQLNREYALKLMDIVKPTKSDESHDFHLNYIEIEKYKK